MHFLTSMLPSKSQQQINQQIKEFNQKIQSINPKMLTAASGFVAVPMGVAGIFGAYCIKPFSSKISPFATGFACSLIPVIMTLPFIFKKIIQTPQFQKYANLIGGIAIGLSYPVAVVSTQLLSSGKVRMIDPAISLMASAAGALLICCVTFGTAFCVCIAYVGLEAAINKAPES